jgi:hypothetical protein
MMDKLTEISVRMMEEGGFEGHYATGYLIWGERHVGHFKGEGGGQLLPLRL